jgi:hypothetical protein
MTRLAAGTMIKEKHYVIEFGSAQPTPGAQG